MCDKCFCSIVPTEILKEFAKRGNIPSKKTLNDTFRILEKRQNILNNLFIQEEKIGNANRLVYDSMYQQLQRVKLIRTEKSSASGDIAVDDAFNLSGVVRDYFIRQFDYHSMNGNGMDIISNVHYGKDYNNAFWDGDEMTYGDGDNLYFKSFASAIDVIGHELTHGVTQYTANLEYYSQPGALNEHFSDVFGTIIKIRHKGQDEQTADWLIGDEVITSEFPGIALRSMKAPGTANEYDTQPAHMDEYYSLAKDNQGVHINSGIPNKAFYLASMALGISDCEKIWFNTLTSLWRNADFIDALDVFIQVAEKLVEQNQVNAHAKEAIVDSFGQVGLTID